MNQQPASPTPVAPVANPPLWRDPSQPIGQRVAALLNEMSLAEKLAQLGSVWLGADASGEVAPMQEVFAAADSWEEATRDGLGHLTRVFGTAPIGPAAGAARLADLQRRLAAETRLGIPAIAHEECLTGFTTLGATIYPTPLALAATFDPAMVQQMAAAIGADLRAVGVHQGLSPVLDVVRDYRWGRVEETLGEDPYLVGTLATAYVRGLQSAGIVATLKHFAGYAASRGARNHAPVSLGRRELADVVLPPFEMALRDGGARSVMNSYADIDGLPPAADHGLFTRLLRDEWGFDGVVVSDYWAVSFLQTAHRVAADAGAAGALALTAGVDVELPNTRCYGDPLRDLVIKGEVPQALVDRAVARVLRQKAELGLLDADWSPEPPGAGQLGSPANPVDLDSAANRALARALAERSIVLLANDSGVLPLRGVGEPAADAPGTGRGEPPVITLLGPCADDPRAFLGCYSFPNHVLAHHPGDDLGVAIPSLLEAARAQWPGAEVRHAAGCSIMDDDRGGFADAVALVDGASVVLLAVGDRAGLFGRGTSGEGCDAADLTLPGAQDALTDAVLDEAARRGVPVVLLVMSGRPYALGRHAGRAAAVVQCFFAGEEGGPALTAVLAGEVNPSGRLPVQVPAEPGGQPTGYLGAPLAAPEPGVTSLSARPLFPFGHGLSYTAFEYRDLRLSADSIAADGALAVTCEVRNAGERDGAEVVQLYLSDPVAQVARPVRQLLGYARVPLAAGESARVAFEVHADRTSFTGVDGERIVEPGWFELSIGSSSADLRLMDQFRIVGETRPVGPGRVLTTPVTISPQSVPPASG